MEPRRYRAFDWPIASLCGAALMVSALFQAVTWYWRGQGHIATWEVFAEITQTWGGFALMAWGARRILAR
jgi:hypothetical protein